MWWNRNPDPLEDFHRRRNLRRLGLAAAVLASLYGAARLLERSSPRWRGLARHPLETLARPAAPAGGAPAGAAPAAPWQGGTGLGTLSPRQAEEWKKGLQPVDQRPTEVQSWFKGAREAESKTEARVDAEPPPGPPAREEP